MTVTLAAHLLAASSALAFGPGGHVEAADGTYDLVAALPGNQALRGNETARRCHAWGSVFPDFRSVVPFRPQLEALRRRIEDAPGVRRVRLDLTDVGPLGFDSHDLRLSLHVVERARRTGSPELLAFALGCLAHGCHDRDEQTFLMHRGALAGRVGDLGIGAVAAGTGNGFEVGGEVQLLHEALREHAQPTSRLDWVSDATRRLAPCGGFRGALRSIALGQRLTAFYHDAARSYVQQASPGAPTISARGLQNAVSLLEAAFVVVPAAFGRESFGSAARTFKSRYVDLAWWADVVYFIGEALARVFTLGTHGVLDLGDLVLDACKGRALSSRPLADVLEGAISGGRSWRRVEARYAANPDFQRLVRSGLLTRAAHGFPEVARGIALDVSARGAASRFVDWPLIDTRSIRGAAAAAYLLDPVPAAPVRPATRDPAALAAWQRALADWQARHERGPLARASGFLVADVRWLDAATLAPLDRLGANDAGRRVRVDVPLRGLHPRAAWLYGGAPLPFEVVVVEDAISGLDPVLARAAVSVPCEQVDPLRMGELAPPVLSLEVAVPLTGGTRGYHVEVRYDGQLVFTTDWDAVAARGATGPQYAAAYGTYHAQGLRSLPIDGR